MDTDRESDLAAAIEKFSAAEQSLRQLLSAAEGMEAARDDLKTARNDLTQAQKNVADAFQKGKAEIQEAVYEADANAAKRLDETVNAFNRRLETSQATVLIAADKAKESLQTSQSAVMDAASGVFNLCREMTDIARDLKDASISIKNLQPEKLERQYDEIRKGQNSIKMAVWVIIILLILLMSAAYFILNPKFL